MEYISLRKSSVAKVLGTIMSIIGALVVTLYHGPMLMSSSHSDWVIGGVLLALQFILVSVSYLVMVYIQLHLYMHLIRNTIHVQYNDISKMLLKYIYSIGHLMSRYPSAIVLKNSGIYICRLTQ